MKTLANPPVVEALAQINYDTSSPVTFEDIEKAASTFSFSNFEDINELILLPGDQTQFNRFGKKLLKPEAGIITQITKTFFASSVTSNYKDWTQFSEFVLDQLATFQKTVKINNVNRMALRYTNRIPIKGGIKNIASVLCVRPVVDNFLDFQPESVSLHTAMPLENIEGRAIVNIRIDQSAKENCILLLDIDVFMIGNFNPDVKNLILEFEKLRDSKNEIFKKVLTNDCISSFS